MEIIDYGDLILSRPNTETPYYLYMYKTLLGDPIQRYIYKSFGKMKLIAKTAN